MSTITEKQAAYIRTLIQTATEVSPECANARVQGVVAGHIMDRAARIQINRETASGAAFYANAAEQLAKQFEEVALTSTLDMKVASGVIEMLKVPTLNNLFRAFACLQLNKITKEITAEFILASKPNTIRRSYSPEVATLILGGN